MDEREPIKRAAGRPPAFHRNAALASAVRAFWRHGYNGADVEQIAAALGATKPSLYRQFSCKEVLFVDALRFYAEKAADRSRETLEAFRTLRGALAALLERTIASYSQPGEPHGCLLACIAIAEAENHPQAGEIFLDATRRIEAAVEMRFTRAIAEGELTANFPARRRAWLFVSVLQACSLKVRAGTPSATLMATIDDIVADMLG